MRKIVKKKEFFISVGADHILLWDTVVNIPNFCAESGTITVNPTKERGKTNRNCICS